MKVSSSVYKTIKVRLHRIAQVKKWRCIKVHASPSKTLHITFYLFIILKGSSCCCLQRWWGLLGSYPRQSHVPTRANFSYNTDPRAYRYKDTYIYINIYNAVDITWRLFKRILNSRARNTVNVEPVSLLCAKRRSLPRAGEARGQQP